MCACGLYYESQTTVHFHFHINLNRHDARDCCPGLSERQRARQQQWQRAQQQAAGYIYRQRAAGLKGKVMAILPFFGRFFGLAIPVSHSLTHLLPLCVWLCMLSNVCKQHPPYSTSDWLTVTCYSTSINRYNLLDCLVPRKNSKESEREISSLMKKLLQL